MAPLPIKSSLELVLKPDLVTRRVSEGSQSSGVHLSLTRRGFMGSSLADASGWKPSLVFVRCEPRCKQRSEIGFAVTYRSRLADLVERWIAIFVCRKSQGQACTARNLERLDLSVLPGFLAANVWQQRLIAQRIPQPRSGTYDHKSTLT